MEDEIIINGIKYRKVKDVVLSEEELMDVVLSKEELIKKGFEVYSYDNRDYRYEDNKGIYHLIRNGKELCKGKEVYSYSNGDYEYEDKKGDFYLFNKNHELISINGQKYEKVD